MNEGKNITTLEIKQGKPDFGLAPSMAVTPMAMLARAIDSGMSIEVVKDLMTMAREWKAEQAQEAWDKAMADAQGEMGVVRGESSNPQTRSKYASLAAIDNALRPIYTAHGLYLTFDTEPHASPDMLNIVCYVAGHGHTRKYQLPMPADGRGAKGGEVMTRTHATGSAVSYGQRYLTKMIFNIAVGDDDGNAAGGRPNGGRSAPPPPPPPEPDKNLPLTEEQFDEIDSLIKETAANVGKLCKFLSVGDVVEMTRAEAKEAIEILKDRQAKQKAQGGK